MLKHTLLMPLLFLGLFLNAQTTVVDVVVGSEDHTLLEAAVLEADLAGALSGDGPFTVFAPTDAAFTALVTALNITADDLLAMDNLGDILQYHVLSGAVMSSDLDDTQTVAMLNGDEATIDFMNGVVTINGAAMVTTANIMADNGVVHVIDAVLLPPAETTTVVDVIVNSEDHTLLEAAVGAADLVGALSGEGPFTVFAPTDAAITALVTALDITADDLLAMEDLGDILTYHVLSGTVLSTDLAPTQTVTMLNGDDATVTSMGGTVMINDATVTVADITTDNGVVHVIDAVILPPVETTTVVDVIVNSDDHTLLEAAVGAADLVGALSGEGPFTVFAPTDAAITALVTALDITADDLLAMEDLGDILTYHVLSGTVLSTDLAPTQTVTMLNGDDATVTSMGGTVMINDATVTVADITTDNGVVHVIDAVILPPVETTTVADIIAGSDDHFVLTAVLDSTGLDETLAGEGPFTVFAPTDAAFDAIDPFVLLDLLTDNDALAEILTYHVAGGTVLSTDLSDGQTITTVNGADVTVSIMDGTVMINDATVIVADLVADNGVVHVIDVVLTVPDPAPSTVVDIIVNSPDHTLLELAVGAAGLVDALSGEGPFTVFAPTDAAIVELVTALDITADELLALETLGDILKYHVVGATALSTDLSDGQILTTLQGGDVEISIDMGVMVNDANVIVADLVADNGVVHVIDAVLSLPSGVDQVNLADLFNVYPNPTVDAVRWNGVQVDRLQVVDVEGRTRIETTNPINTIDLSSLESGLFFLVIEAEGQRTVKSVLKQ